MKFMNRNLISLLLTMFALAIVSSGQTRVPSSSSKPVVIKTKQEVTSIYRELEKQDGNKNLDIVPAAGTQMRVAVFHDQKRENDNFEVHDSSDDIYYVLEGAATLMLGGALTNANEISPGEWRSKTASGGKPVKIQKGDLIIVPRGTVHQRTVTGKGFSMILIKVFADTVKAQ
jgi:mannose-6-phosphate isomerase-like protein (cupin superfamily)